MCKLKEEAMERAGELPGVPQGEIAALTAECAVLAEKVGAADSLRYALQDIVNCVPAHNSDGGGFFVEHHGPDGEYLGAEQINPDSIIQEMQSIATNALSAAPVAQPSAQATVAAYPTIHHPDDSAVDRFAAAMKRKMASSRAKGRSGWDNEVLCPVERLQAMLADHMAKGDPVDVGNFAMMLYNRNEHTVSASQEPSAQVRDAGVPTWQERRGKDIELHGEAEPMAVYVLREKDDLRAALAAAQLPAQGTVTEAGPFTLEQRMPPKDTEVLIYWPCTDGTFEVRVDEWSDLHEDPIGMGGPTICVGEGWVSYGDENVTHWAPIAAPAQQPTDSAAQSGESGCRMTGGICACRSGGSFGGCAKDRADCCTNEHSRRAAQSGDEGVA